MLEFLHSHTNVVFQPPYNSQWYSRLTRTLLGFAMFGTLSVFASRRPKKTATGSRISPALTGWKRCISRCVISKDESLSASSCHRRSVRDFRFFTVLDDDHNNYRISAIHNEEGIGRSARSCPPNTTSATSGRIFRYGRVDLRGDAH